MLQEKTDNDIAIIKSRKIIEQLKQVASDEKSKKIKKQHQQQQAMQGRTNRELLLKYLYNRGEEVLILAESQFPNETRTILNRLINLIKNGEITERISGGDLMALFRTLGMNVKVNTSIKIEDHGKLLSFSDKLKEDYGDTVNDS
jgi:DNA-binding TFAR19-related protein (PDSD5 family)